MLLIKYGLVEIVYLLVGDCLQVLLKELPCSMHSPGAIKFFCNVKVREKLAMAGHVSFLLYYFLSQIVIERDTLLERLAECATEN